MSNLRVVVVPVGRVPTDEVEGALTRVAKIINRPIELREPAALAAGTLDSTRNQYRAPELLAALRRGLAGLKVARLIGADVAGSPVPTPAPDAAIFVTDVDLFNPTSEGVFGQLDGPHHAALLSVRRLREAFYRRKADPAKQRARLVKQVLRVIGLLRGQRECRDPSCVMSPGSVVADIDRRRERYCARCWKHISTGSFRI